MDPLVWCEWGETEGAHRATGVSPQTEMEVGGLSDFVLRFWLNALRRTITEIGFRIREVVHVFFFLFLHDEVQELIFIALPEELLDI